MEEPRPEQRRQEEAEPVPPKPEPEQKQAGYTPPEGAPKPPFAAFIDRATDEAGNAEYNVILKSAGPRVINVIKVIRDLTGVELAEAKSIVDSAPSGAVKRSVSKETAEAMKARLTEAGAEVEIVQPGYTPPEGAPTPPPMSCQNGIADYMIMPIEDLMEAANRGYPQAQYALADRYQDGEDVPEDPAQADMWYKRAFPQLLKLAEQGDKSIQHDVAGMYYFAQGVEVNFTEALKWYRRSADQGYSPAQSMLGQMYENGEGVEKDIPTAIMWYKKAAADGLKSAKEALKRLEPGGKTGFLRGLFK